MMKSWLIKQTEQTVEQWDNSLTFFYPDTKKWMSGPKPYLQRLVVECNYLNAAKQIDWDKYIVEDALILDIGCGGGWLSAYLSSFDKVKHIESVDSSLNYLQNFVPDVVNLLGGNLSKISRIQGLFAPILADSNSIDLIVISSALHHAPSIPGVLQEFKRVLKPKGTVIILNETPSNSLLYIYKVTKAFVNIISTIATKQYREYAQKISAAGFLYDPYLGDVDYPEWYWRKAIAGAGLSLEYIHNTKLATVVNTSGRALKHFICRKK